MIEIIFLTLNFEICPQGETESGVVLSYIRWALLGMERCSLGMKLS